MCVGGGGVNGAGGEGRPTFQLSQLSIIGEMYSILHCGSERWILMPPVIVVIERAYTHTSDR